MKFKTLEMAKQEYLGRSEIPQGLDVLVQGQRVRWSRSPVTTFTRPAGNKAAISSWMGERGPSRVGRKGSEALRAVGRGEE